MVYLFASRLKQLTSASRESPDYVLSRMVASLWPSFKLRAPAYTSKSCHAMVVRTIWKRKKAKDKIWLFGDKSTGQVIHSVLTDGSNHVLQDTLSNNGWFLGFKGYMRANPDDETDTDMDEFLQCITVADMRDEFRPSHLISV
jgi:hypothetical protein